MKPRTNNRLRLHICKSNRGAFLPLSRMRTIRWEEAVQYSAARRQGRKDKLTCNHWNCCCGSINCLANPLVQKESNET